MSQITIAEESKSARQRWAERTQPRSALAPSLFPADAHAVIYREGRSVMTSGKARCGKWKLRFERWSPPSIEPLMGWTAGDDTLTQVELTFPSLETAVSYARRQGLTFTVQGQQSATGPRLVSQTANVSKSRRLEWVERTLGPDLIRNGFGPGADPARTYGSPQAVLDDATLAVEAKRDLLQRWARNAYLAERAAEQSATDSRLDEVIDALIDLDGIPHTVISRGKKAEAEAA